MTKRFYLVLAVVCVGVSLIGAPAQSVAQDSSPKGNVDRVSRSNASDEKNAKDPNPVDKNNNYPENLPEAQGPIALRPDSGTRITLKLTDSSRAVYESIGQQAKIDVLFDPDYAPQSISVDLNRVPLPDALKIVAFESHTFWRPVTSDTIFVAADTSGKRREFEQQFFKAFYFPITFRATELQDVVNSLRTILEIPRIQQVPSDHAILVRAGSDQMALAEKLVNELNISKEKIGGQYRLEFRIHENSDDKKTDSRIYTLLVAPYQTAKLSVACFVNTKGPDSKAQACSDLSRTIGSEIQAETETAVSVHFTVGFPDFGSDNQVAAAQAEQVTMESSAILELGSPMVVGSFEDPVSKRSFQIEATATRTGAGNSRRAAQTQSGSWDREDREGLF